MIKRQKSTAWDGSKNNHELTKKRGSADGILLCWNVYGEGK